MIETLKKIIWRLIFIPYYRFIYYRTKSDRMNLYILNSVETVLYIIKNKCSVCRYGDGEFQMITHYLNNNNEASFHVDTFQKYSAKLASRLIEVFKSKNNKVLICIPYSFKDSSVYRGYERTFFERDWLFRKSFILQERNQLFGDSCFTRFFLKRTDINVKSYIALLKSIWNNRNILIVEGKQSRLGVGNDLFENAVSVKRILCPVTNAFDKYGEILSEVQKYSKEYLCLLALGHTATVLAFDLSDSGYQAIDIGHIDVEYEWYLMGAKEKVPIPNRYVNEVKEGRIYSDLKDDLYNRQIIAIIE